MLSEKEKCGRCGSCKEEERGTEKVFQRTALALAIGMGFLVHHYLWTYQYENAKLAFFGAIIYYWGFIMISTIHKNWENCNKCGLLKKKGDVCDHREACP